MKWLRFRSPTQSSHLLRVTSGLARITRHHQDGVGCFFHTIEQTIRYLPRRIAFHRCVAPAASTWRGRGATVGLQPFQSESAFLSPNGTRTERTKKCDSRSVKPGGLSSSSEFCRTASTGCDVLFNQGLGLLRCWLTQGGRGNGWRRGGEPDLEPS